MSDLRAAYGAPPDPAWRRCKAGLIPSPLCLPPSRPLPPSPPCAFQKISPFFLSLPFPQLPLSSIFRPISLPLSLFFSALFLTVNILPSDFYISSSPLPVASASLSSCRVKCCCLHISRLIFSIPCLFIRGVRVRHLRYSPPLPNPLTLGFSSRRLTPI